MEENFRRKLIERLSFSGHLSENEILGILLSNAFGGSDATEYADKLLGVFPSVYAVLGATRAELAITGIPENVIDYLLVLGLSSGEKEAGTQIKNSDDCAAVANGRIGGRDVEYLEVYMTDANCRLLDVFSYTSNLQKRVIFNGRELVKRIAENEADGIYFVHNHVGCGVEPSQNDDVMTKRLVDVCRLSGVKFLDHCIINGGKKYFSYIKSGRINKIYHPK